LLRKLYEFLFVLAQLGTMLYVNKREAKCTLLIVRHFDNCAAVFSLLQLKIWDFILLLRLGLFLICT